MMCEDFKYGDRIVIHNKTRLDHAAEGRVGMFVEYTRPHGFARVALDAKPEWADQGDDLWVVHPESIERLLVMDDIASGDPAATERYYAQMLAIAKQSEPEGATCAMCGDENTFADDCGWFYIDTPKGYKPSCRKCVEKFGPPPGDR